MRRFSTLNPAASRPLRQPVTLQQESTNKHIPRLQGASAIKRWVNELKLELPRLYKESHFTGTGGRDSVW